MAIKGAIHNFTPLEMAALAAGIIKPGEAAQVAMKDHPATKQVSVDSGIQDRHYAAIRELRARLNETPAGDMNRPHGLTIVDRCLWMLWNSPTGTRITAKMKTDFIEPAWMELKRETPPAIRRKENLSRIRELVFQLPTAPGLPSNLTEDKLIAIKVQVRRWKKKEINPQVALKAIESILNVKEVASDDAKEEVGPVDDGLQDEHPGGDAGVLPL